MRVTLYTPDPQNDLISEFWYMKLPNHHAPKSQMIPPFGKPELIFFIGAPYQIQEANVERCLIKGQYTILQTINLKENANIFGIRLQPYALFNLIGYNTSTLSDSVLDGNQFEFMQAISELLQTAANIDLSLLQKIADVLKRAAIHKTSASTRAFLNRVSTHQSNKINEILADCNFSVRTLQRNFQKEVGLTPKKFLRLIRVNQIEEILRNTDDWIEVVTRFNLADQSHLIKEIKNFRQNNPTEMINKKMFLHQQLPPPEIVPIKLDL